jgi:ABC-2 type transport system permease protein
VRKYRLLSISPYGDNASDEVLRAHVLAETYDGILILERDVFEENTASYLAKNVTDFQEIRRLESAVSGVIVSHRLSESGFDPTRVQELTRDVDLRALKATKEGTTEETGSTYLVGVILVLFLYMTTLLYGISVMRSVLEEKSSRVIEVVLTSVKPFQLMMGKILGTGAVGLVQFGVWSGFGILTILYGGAISSAFGSSEIPLQGTPMYIFFYFILYFLLGYFLYAAMYAAVGAIATTDQEAQQIQRPVTILIIIPILLMQLYFRNPDSQLAIVLSHIPFFSPILMFMRICIVMPSPGEILLSIAVLLTTILVAVWVVAKIYRVGILMYGKRPTFPEIVKWIRY